jgi:hypothetical protein
MCSEFSRGWPLEHRELLDFADAPRGWQANPVISREAAAMCSMDYKSATWRPRQKQDDGKKLYKAFINLWR